jgi:cell division protein FtsZ
VKPPKPAKVQAKQEVLQFESVTRGRFEKSEPTIVEGQDLDVPTFLRKNIRVK